MKRIATFSFKGMLIPVLLLLLTTQRTEAQTYMWYHAFGGIEFQYPAHISIDLDENTYLTGTFHSPYFYAGPLFTKRGLGYNYFALKLDPAGNPVLLTGPHDGSFHGRRIFADSKGNIYVSAMYFWYSWLIKNQHLPVCIWGGHDSGLFIKYNSKGEIQWYKSFLCDDYNMAWNAHVLASDNDIIVAGMGYDTLYNQMTNQVEIEHQINIRSLDSLGNTKWYHSIYTPSTSFNTRIQFRQIHFGPDNLIYVLGNKHYDTLMLNGLFLDASPYRNFIMRLDTTGNIIDHFYIQSTDDFSVYDLVVDGDGNLFLTGEFKAKVFQLPGMPAFVNTDTVWPNTELFFAKVTPQGNPVWVHTAQNNSRKLFVNIHLDDAGCVYLSGDFAGQVLNLSSGTSLTHNNPPGYNAFLLKYDSTGNLMYHLISSVSSQGVWSPLTTFALAGIDDLVLAAATIPDHGIFGGVTVNGFGGVNDIFTCRFTMTTDVTKIERGEISVNLYPNPVTDELNVEFRPGELSFPTKIRILDLHGREMESRNLSCHETRMVFSCTHLSSGVYLLHISGNEVDKVKKFLVSR